MKVDNIQNLKSQIGIKVHSFLLNVNSLQQKKVYYVIQIPSTNTLAIYCGNVGITMIPLMDNPCLVQIPVHMLCMHLSMEGILVMIRFISCKKRSSMFSHLLNLIFDLVSICATTYENDISLYQFQFVLCIAYFNYLSINILIF